MIPSSTALGRSVRSEPEMRFQLALVGPETAWEGVKPETHFRFDTHAAKIALRRPRRIEVAVSTTALQVQRTNTAFFPRENLLTYCRTVGQSPTMN
jgi:hypothetical protein